MNPVQANRRQGAALATANYFTAATRAGMFVLLARTVPPQTVGNFALATAIAAPVQLLSDMRLRHLIATDADREFAPEQYTLANLFTSASAFVFLGSIAVVVGVSGNPEFGLLLSLISLAKFVESFNNVAQGEYQRDNQRSTLAASIIVKSLAGLIGFAAALLLSDSASAAVAGLVGGTSLAVLLFDLRCGGINLHWNRGTNSLAGRIIRKAAPLGVAALMTSLSTVVVRYAIAWLRGTGDLALYSSAEYLTAPLALATLTVSQLRLSNLGLSASNLDQSSFRSRYRSGCTWIVASAGVLMMASAAFGQTLLRFLYGGGYASVRWTLLILVAWGGVSSVAGFTAQALTAVGENRRQPGIALTTLVVTSGVALALIPTFGVNGGAVGLLVGAAINLAILGVTLNTALLAFDRPPLVPQKDVT